MYSSLPSASKLYASAVTKNKKSGVTNARKKRRKSKVLPLNTTSKGPTEATTLVSAIQNDVTVSLNYDSDTTESISENTVQFYSGEEKPRPDIKLKPFLDEQYDGTPQSFADDHSIHETNVNAQDGFKIVPSIVENEVPCTMDSASAKIHDDFDDEEQGPLMSKEEEELNFNEDFGELPIIVISSSDSPEHDTGIKAEDPVSCGLDASEANEFVPSELLSKHHQSETDPEAQENNESCEIRVEECCETYNNTIPDIILPVSVSESSTIPTQTDCSQAFISSYLSVGNRRESEGIDDISVKSDCCSSKNIYNEYSTETVDDSEPHFMIDDSKPSSTEECSSSLSESDEVGPERSSESDEVGPERSSESDEVGPERSSESDEVGPERSSESEEVEPVRITSPGTSEISGTESSIGDSKKMTREANKPIYPRTIDFKPISNVPEAACYMPPYGLNIPEVTCISSCENVITRQRPCIKEMFLNRTQSLPNYLNYRYSKNVSFNGVSEYCHIEDFPSSISVIKSCCEVDEKWSGKSQLSQSSANHRASGNQIAESCMSSTASLTSGSSVSYRVLPPVTTKEARLRSYVVGSVRASGSLLGVEELLRYFPEKKVNVFVGTWNMNGQDAPHCIDDFLLPLGVNYLSDIYAIGVQESSQSRNEWEVLMQTTLGPSHVLLTSTSLGVLHLAIFIRRDLIWFCSEPEDAHVATRPGSMVKTKGAVAISFTFFGTSFLFINSHLTAHEKKLKERLADYEKICQMIDLPKKIPLKLHYQSKDVTSRFDNVFWCGDLNFRVIQDRPSVLGFVEEKLRQTMHTCDFLLQHDQLHKAMNEGIAFHGFHEGVINFVPSYKFDIGTCCFNSTKQRVPSYTDRVLYRCKKSGAICCLHYNVVSDIMTSDHKPVFAVFEVNVSPGRDNIPLAAGLFKRDVYLQACRRRATALEVASNQKSSTICSVM